MFRILCAEKYKGMIRIGFLAGRRLLRDSRLLRQNASIVSRALSVPVNESGKGVLEFLEKTSQTEKRLKALEEKAIIDKAEALVSKAALLKKNQTGPGGSPVIVIESYAEEDINEVQSIGKAAQKLSIGKPLPSGEQQIQAAFILASEQDCKFVALCASKEFDLRSLMKEALEAQGGKGGGGPSFFQGSFGTKYAMDNFLRKIGEGSR
jgi:alanyl-tRNA synthetase